MKPLAGIRILDMSRLLPGPYATHVLAELGASVDKLEDTDAGDYLRHVPPTARSGIEEGATDGTAREMGAMFTLLNRNKRSVSLDLKSDEGRKTFRALLPHYDVLFDQFRPGVLARLGLGHDALVAAHPRLIICALTGYGQTGPLALRAGHDLNYLARGGVLGFQGPAESAPAVPGGQIADIGGALYSVIAILAALRERDRTGSGAVLDVSMQDAAMSFAISGFASALAGSTVSRGNEPLTGGLCVYSTYETSDGRFVAFAALEPKFWGAFCAIAGWELDTSALIPGPHQTEWTAKLAAFFRTRTRDAWAELGANHAICLEPVLTPEEALNDAHVRERGLVRYSGAEMPTWGLPFREAHDERSSVESVTKRGAPPTLGEHTPDILAECGAT